MLVKSNAPLRRGKSCVRLVTQVQIEGSHIGSRLPSRDVPTNWWCRNSHENLLSLRICPESSIDMIPKIDIVADSVKLVNSTRGKIHQWPDRERFLSRVECQGAFFNNSGRKPGDIGGAMNGSPGMIYFSFLNEERFRTPESSNQRVVAENKKSKSWIQKGGW